MRTKDIKERKTSMYTHNKSKLKAALYEKTKGKYRKLKRRSKKILKNVFVNLNKIHTFWYPMSRTV